MAKSEHCQVFAGKACDVLVTNSYSPCGRPQNAAHDREQSGFSAAGRSHKQQNLASVSIQIHAVQSSNDCSSGTKDLFHGRYRSNGIHALKTIAGSRRITLWMEINDALIPMNRARKNMLTTSSHGATIIAPAVRLRRKTAKLTPMPKT